jgi:hypothetical protein
MKLDSSNSSKKSGNTKQISPSKHWCFTLNNYNQSHIDMFLNVSSSIVPKFIFQEEKGENGTPHLQGYLCFAKKSRPLSVFDSKLIHWEPCRNVKKSIAYCKKGDTRNGKCFGRKISIPFIQSIDKLYLWEEEIITILKKEPDDRTLYWYWEPNGCAGKTTFQKYIFSHFDGVLIVSGKASDMKHAVVEYINKSGDYPKIILCNIPRSSLNFISWTGIEEVKDMFFHSGKYEGGQVCGPPPHFIIFANEYPDKSNVSKDRWIIKKIKKENPTKEKTLR